MPSTRSKKTHNDTSPDEKSDEKIASPAADAVMKSNDAGEEIDSANISTKSPVDEKQQIPSSKQAIQSQHHRVKFAVICASNQNRSMEAHSVLARRNFNVHSYGTGSNVRLPGPSPRQPNIYEFGTPYTKILDDLISKDPDLYQQNGLLAMLNRNIQIKTAPQKWHQELDKMFDVVVTCEERCFDSVCEDLMRRGGKKNRLVHVLNMDIRDNPDDAAIGGRLILQLAQMIEASRDLDEEIEHILDEFLKKNPETPLLYNVCFY